MSVCSLDKLASIDIPAAKNSGIFGLPTDAVSEIASVLEVPVWISGLKLRSHSIHRRHDCRDLKLSAWLFKALS